jgi:hypothetical protein
MHNAQVELVSFHKHVIKGEQKTALREDDKRVNLLGLYDLDRRSRAVGRAYKELIADWNEAMRTGSVCMMVPLGPCCA